MLRVLPLLAALACFAMPSLTNAQSIEDMAGQMIVVGFKGDSVEDASFKAVRDAVAEGRIGGVMYLKTNVASKAAVTAMNAALRDASPNLMPFITIDQEGGAVERLTKSVGFEEIGSAESIANNNSPAQAKAIYADLARRIKALGFSVNFGPVADVNLNRNNQVIAKFGRAFSSDPGKVADYDQAFIDAHHDAGLLTSLKHFPGHGSSTDDSHEGFVDISKSWDPAELEPYARLFEQGYQEFVMIGHLFHDTYVEGDERTPASLSKYWIIETLRQQMNFQGVVISDDLEMGAIRQHYGFEETITRAVWAGMDVLLYSNTAAYDPKLGDRIRGVLVAEAKADPAFATRIEQSYRRIVAMKQRIAR